MPPRNPIAVIFGMLDTMPLEHLRKRAGDLAGWLMHTLAVREARSKEGCQAIVDALLKNGVLYGPEAKYDNWLSYSWSLFTPSGIKLVGTGLDLECDPPIELIDVELGLGLIAATCAVECLKSRSHTQRLLGAYLIIEASEVQEHWFRRGFQQCRNPNSSEFDASMARGDKIRDETKKEIVLMVHRHERAAAAANARHAKAGASRDKRAKIREIWAMGKYKTLERCAEQECDALGMSFSTARKALRNAPKPKRP